MKENLYRSLMLAHPFIYDISGKLYYIGRAVFRECTKEETDLFNRYLTEWKSIKALGIDMQSLFNTKPAEVKDISDITDKILNADNLDYYSSNESKIRREFRIVFNQLLETDIQSLNQQKENFIKSLDYSDLNRKESLTWKQSGLYCLQ